MKFFDFPETIHFTQNEINYGETGMAWMSQNYRKFKDLPEKQAKRAMYRAVISQIKKEYNLGAIASILLWSILSQIAKLIVAYWWDKLSGEI